MQIGVSYDGSARAEGMHFLSMASQASAEIVRNQPLQESRRRRRRPFFRRALPRNRIERGRLDELRIYKRPLAPLEVAQLFDGHALSDALAAKDAALLRPYYLAALSASLARVRADRREAVKNYFQARNSVQETSVMEELPAPAADLRSGPGALRRAENRGPPRRPRHARRPAAFPRRASRATASAWPNG